MTTSRALLSDLRGVTAKDLMAIVAQHQVRFVRLQFTDILGVNKNVEVPTSQLKKALEGDILFDGSSIEGFVRVEESDMLLRPDLETFRIFPWSDPQARVARQSIVGLATQLHLLLYGWKTSPCSFYLLVSLIKLIRQMGL